MCLWHVAPCGFLAVPCCMLQVRPMETGSVALSQVVTEEQLVERSEAFENAVTGRDRSALQASWGRC